VSARADREPVAADDDEPDDVELPESERMRAFEQADVQHGGFPFVYYISVLGGCLAASSLSSAMSSRNRVSLSGG